MAVDKVTETLILNGERVGTEDMKRFWRERPDPDFDINRHNQIVANTIKKAEARRQSVRKAQNEGLKDRANALASYIKYLDRGGRKKVEDYFGKRELGRLQAKKTMTVLQERKANGLPLWKVINTE